MTRSRRPGRLARTLAAARALWWTVVTIAVPPRQPPMSERDRQRITAEYDGFAEDVVRFEERRHP